MFTATELKEYAWLAQASYSDLSTITSVRPLELALTQPLNSAFSLQQAQEFSAQFSLVSHIRDPEGTGLTDTGISATVFRERNTGRVILSFAGTEFKGDLLRDLVLTDIWGIGTVGYAPEECEYVYRYVKQLQTAGQNYVQYSDEELLNLYLLQSTNIAGLPTEVESFAYFSTRLRLDKGIWQADGSSAVVQPGLKVDVVGHSLGGHLAMLAQRLFPGLFNQVATVNAMEFYPVSTGAIDYVLAERMLSEFGEWDESRILRMEAEGDGVSELGIREPGLELAVSNEYYGASPPAAFGNNHSAISVSDGLALIQVIGLLDKKYEQDVTTAKPLVRASSNQPGKEYEQLLDAVRRMLQGADVTPTAFDDANAPSTSRASFYDHLKTLRDTLKPNDQNGSGIGGSLIPVAGKLTLASAAEFANFESKSKTDFGAFLALQFLSPVVISTADAGALGALKGVHSQLATEWQSDVNARLYGDTDYALTFTDEWFEDRAKLLTALAKVNAQNSLERWLNDASAPADRSLVFHYRAPDDSSMMTLGLSRDNALRATQDIFFGGDGAETLSGMDNLQFGDRLYGGGGADQLVGRKGNDYLEGNAGDDKLDGGAGSDTLLGGLGFDTYVLDARDGAASMDTLRDADGSGVVSVRDALGSVALLDGGRRVADGTWVSANGRFNYSLTNEGTPEQTLVVRGGGVQARIVGWTQQGTLGIRLEDAAPLLEPAGSRTILGDLQRDPINERDDLGNFVTTSEPDPGRSDLLWGSDSADIVRSGGGRDYLYSKQGNDWIEAGEGRDYVGAAEGDDIIWGNAPTALDVLDAQLTATSDDEADLLQGGEGRDLIVGGASNDAMLGEDGADTLIGGAGDDNIFGDRWLPTTQVAFWSWQRIDELDADGKQLRRLYGFRLEGFVDPDFGLDQQADVILGGAGDDWIFGDGGDDIIDGGIGADFVYGGPGADFVEGGDGKDELYGDGWDTGPASLSWTAIADHGNDVIDGGAGDDVIVGGGGHDYLAGGDGSDVIFGDNSELSQDLHGDDVLDGGGGDDLLWGDGGHDTLSGSDGNDQLVGDAGRDQLDGGAGHDVLLGDGRETAAQDHDDDILSGGDGNDSMEGGGGADLLEGGSGDDSLFGDDTRIPTDSHGSDALFGGDGVDHLEGMGGDDYLEGGDGADNLLGGDGADLLIGGPGLDGMDGGAGDDTYIVVAGETGSMSLGIVEMVGDEDGQNRIVFRAGFDLGSMRLYPNGNTNTWLAVQGDHAVAIAGLWGGGGAGIEFGSANNGEVGHVTLSAQEFFGTTWDQVVGRTTDLAGAQLIGGRLNDTLTASGSGASLWGGQGDDTLLASGGQHTFHYRAGDGHDAIADTSSLMDAQGVSQRSSLRFGADVASSDITLTHNAGGLVLNVGGGGSVALSGFDRNNALAPAAVDRFTFSDGTELTRSELLARGFDIAGTSGADVLMGTSLVDRLNAGAGDDTVSGGAGADVYGFDLGDGHDVFADGDVDAGGQDSVLFGEGIYSRNLAARRVGADVVLLAGSDDSVTLRAYFVPGQDTIEHILFADGTRWGAAEVSARLLLGTSGDETILGGIGADTIASQSGSDRMEGGLGDDTYRFELGDGHDVVFDAGGADRVLFGAGINSSALSFALDGGDLVVRVGAEDRLTLAAYVAADPNAQLIERFEFADGSVMTRAEVYLQLLRATDEADEIYGFASNDVIDGLGGNDNIDGGAGDDSLSGGAGHDDVYGGSGNDLLSGGGGSDSLFGGAGSDIYRIDDHRAEVDSSYVTIDERLSGGVSGIDTVRLGPGTSPSTVRFRVATDSSNLVIAPYPDQWVLVLGQFAADSSSSQIERFEFGDGTVWTAQQARDASLLGAPNSETIRGFASADRITGGYGHDTLSGEGGDDRLQGDEGNDVLDGASGHDTLDGGTGDDVLAGGEGNDLLDGGAGRDRLDGGSGNDVYNFGPGSGPDIITQDASGVDEVRLAGGLTAAQVKLYRVSSPASSELPFNGDSLVIQLNNGGDQLWIANYFAAATDGFVETIAFGDGSRWDRTAVNARLSSLGGTANTITGTRRADTFVIDHWNDVLPTPTEGDLAVSSASYRVSGAALAGFSITGGLNLFAVVGDGSHRVKGNAGDNRFDVTNVSVGALYEGGSGNDLYVSTRLNDSVLPGRNPAELSIAIAELAGQGHDTYRSGYWSAQLPAHVEDLILVTPNATQSGSYSVYVGSPNDFSHRFIGNELANTIDSTAYEDGAQSSWWSYQNGLLSSARVVRLDGGAGADTLIGGALQNVYVVDHAGDLAIETGVDWSGTDLSIDTIETQFATALETRPHIENIRLTGQAPVAATGDAKANQLDGSLNSAANVLSGAAGDDTYIVGLADVVIEAADAGHDTVVVAAWTTSTVRITDFTQVEAVRLGASVGDLALEGGAGADSLVGSWGNNRIAGGDGNDQLADQYIEDAVSYYGGSTWHDADVLEGGAGDDNLISYRGSDVLDGGAGNDNLVVERGASRSVKVRFGLGDGQDILYSMGYNSISTDLAIELRPGVGLGDLAFQTISDHASLTLADGSSLYIYSTSTVANVAAFRLTELILPDGVRMSGQATLDALARTTDRRTPTPLADLLAGTDQADVVLADAGDDLVLAGAGDDLVRGGVGNDTLYGGAGADTLHGDAGHDLLAGGHGSDVYRFSRGFGNDVIDDMLGTGVNGGSDDGAMDRVEFDATIAVADLAVYARVEGTLLTGLVLALPSTGDSIDLNRGHDPAAAGAVESVRFSDGTQWDLNLLRSKVSGQVGGSLADTLTGTSGADVFDGRGGADTMTGLSGNDSYHVDSTGDVVVEAASAGTDTVLSSITYQLGANVENLRLVGISVIDGYGNALANAMIGNAAANRLDGGAGADVMSGGGGNDTYIVDSTSDSITELAGEGTDTLVTALSWTLGATSNIENLTLTGSAKVKGTGNALDNVLIGNSVANTLTGGAGNDTLDGGGGADILIGGTGADTYVFGRSSGIDTVQDNDSTAGVVDRVLFGAGIVQADTVYQRNSNNLEVLIRNTTDKLILSNWYLGTQYQVERFAYADGTTLSNSQVASMVSAMATFDQPAAVATRPNLSAMYWRGSDLAAAIM